MTFLSSVSPAKELLNQSVITGTPKLVVGIRSEDTLGMSELCASKKHHEKNYTKNSIIKLLKVKRKMKPDRNLGIYKEIKSTENDKYVIHFFFRFLRRQLII